MTAGSVRLQKPLYLILMEIEGSLSPKSDPKLRRVPSILIHRTHGASAGRGNATIGWPPSVTIFVIESRYGLCVLACPKVTSLNMSLLYFSL